jgi:hypothetical protein
MSPFFDELEEQLRSAARVRAGGEDPPPAPRRGRAWLHAGLGAVPVAAAVLVTLVVVGGALVLLGHRGHHTPMPSTTPPAGNVGAILAKTPKRQLVRELAYISAATRATMRSPACHVDTPTGVSLIHGSPGMALTSTLGVLTRPATAADKLSPANLSGTPDVYAGYVRRALSAGGVSYFIVPARYDPSASVPSNRCFDLQLAALRSYLPHVEPSLRQPTMMLAAGLIAYARNLVARSPRDTICLTTVSRNSGSSDCGISAAQIRAGMPAADDNGTFSGVVPDGVAAVTLTFAASSGHAGRTVTTRVIDNVYAVHVPGVAAQAQPGETWHSVQDTVIKRLAPPSPRTASAACRHEAATCLLAEISSVQSTGAQYSGSGVQYSESSSSSSSTTAASASPRSK